MTVETPVRPVGLDTVEEALAALRKIVQGREDYVYAPPILGGSCAYTDPETRSPSCMIGALLIEHGVPVDLFYQQTNANVMSVAELVSYGLVELTKDVARVLTMAQGAQDNQRPWGAAVQHAADYAFARAQA